MTKVVVKYRADDSARDRILKAAILRFSTHSYETTGLRDLAADAGVDVAYVHRCFGSKEKLFREALRAVFQSERLFAGDADDLPSVLAKELLRKKGRHEVRPLDMLVHSFSSPDASRVLRNAVMDDFVGPLREKREQVSEQQAALVAAFLAGVGILRDVIRADSLLEEEGGGLEDMIGRVIKAMMDGDPDCSPGLLSPAFRGKQPQ